MFLHEYTLYDKNVRVIKIEFPLWELAESDPAFWEELRNTIIALATKYKMYANELIEDDVKITVPKAITDGPDYEIVEEG